MATAQLSPVIHSVRQVTAQQVGGLPDSQLLHRFAATREAAAFTALVQRHGGMIWGICRRLLRDRHAAEDAFQATFLVLVHKAGAIGNPELLGNWLYGVAYRTALKARARSARRRQRERPLEDLPASSDTASVDSEERLILDQEIHRLPESCRQPFVLCYLQGKTNDQAAHLLGWPKGTVASRLRRARLRLRGALRRHGLTLSVALVYLSRDSLSAAVPATLADATVQAALLGVGPAVAAGCVAAGGASLAKGVLKAMFMTKIKITMAILVGVGMLGIGASKLFYAIGQPTGSSAVPLRENEPAQVGQIIIVGNKHTASDVILDQIPLHPGEVITYPDLRRAAANLVQHNIPATVEIVDPESDNPVKNVLVTVQETRSGSLVFGLGVNSPANLPTASNQPTLPATDETHADKQRPFWVRTNGVTLRADEIRLAVFRALYEAADGAESLAAKLKAMRHVRVGLDELAETQLVVAEVMELAKKQPQAVKKLKEFAAKDAERFLASDTGKAFVQFQETQGIPLDVLHHWREHIYMAEEYKRHLCYPFCERIRDEEVARATLFRSSDKATQAEIRARLETERVDQEWRKVIDSLKSQAAAKQPRPDLEDLPVGSLVLACGEAKVFATSQADGKVKLHIEGCGQAAAAGPQFRGKAEAINYDEEKQLFVLNGSAHELAKLEMETFTIEGPEVNIDQKDNKAWVAGLGFMRMPSDANFQGEKLNEPSDKSKNPDGKPKEPVYLTVHWNRDMFFDGKLAVFHGGIQAEQENSRLTCQELQAYLDRFVSLRQAENTEPPAKVKKLVCDKDVRVEEKKFQPPENRVLIGYQWMKAPGLVVDNEENTVHASGPGEVRILQPQPQEEGPARPGASRPPSPVPTSGPDEMRLTKINYWGSMFGNNNSHTAIFYNNVELVNAPSNDPGLNVDLDKLPPGAMYLRCNQLKVYSRRQADGKAMQEMEAHGKALVQAQEYWGRADIIKYDESKEVLVFESGEGNLATLNRAVPGVEAPQELRGKKIYYWIGTGNYKIESGGSRGAVGR
jgi:RNA polymerase sigma factor (sigma-70 family)